jgi:hypothetical protein
MRSLLGRRSGYHSHSDFRQLVPYGPGYSHGGRVLIEPIHTPEEVNEGEDEDS